jgi:hypothetical protein
MPFLTLLKPKLNPSAQRCLPKFLVGILIFKGPTARRLYKSFDVKGLTKSIFALYPTDSIYRFRKILTTGSQYITERRYVVGLIKEVLCAY